MTMLRVLDLFSGIGGFSLGLERTGGFETVAFCEYEPFPRAVLAKHWPNVPCFLDVRTLKGSDIDGPVDVICGGYPCQPFSTAGQRRGKEDDRHLWPEFNRLVAELRPAWVIGENVAGHISMGLDDVLSDLERQGYACRTFVIPACAVGAPHRRDRVWTVAHSKKLRGNVVKSQTIHGGTIQPVWKPRRSCCADIVADANSTSSQRQGEFINSSNKKKSGKGETIESLNGCERGERCVEPELGRVFDGLSYWLDEPRERVSRGTPNRAPRLKALGNAVVPQIPEMIGYAILQAEKERP
ncbi:MAG: DNA cytosine methyltransferase [Marivivens sp.]|nr:DNA cytosine methyltransferase [Marivivens sp.]